MGEPDTFDIGNEDYTLSITVKDKKGKAVPPDAGGPFPSPAVELLGVDCITIVKARVNPGYIIVCSGGVCRKYWI